jgi:hypothetical protein
MKKLLFVFALMFYVSMAIDKDNRSIIQTEQSSAVATATYSGLV